MSQKPKLDQHFDPKRIEAATYDRWETAGHFQPVGNTKTYSIAIPPPNVTGTLHLGHAFQHTIMDTLIRYQRMSGRTTLWQTGTDHAGIATQMVVTEQLRNEGKTLNDLGRDGFVDRVWQWREESGSTITEQMRRIGSSVDWSRERFTMDPDYNRAVNEVFVRLFDEGLIYRGKHLVNWDPTMGTALSDLEVVSVEEDGHLWYLRYALVDGVTTRDGLPFLVVATTRPETMLGDTAVAVHPHDERYEHLIGKTVLLPLVNREIPVIADQHVDMAFGTGCLKITPAHDFDDYEIGKRHDLPLINIFDSTAHINENAPAKYQGLGRTEARAQVIEDLEQLDLVDRTESHKVQIPRGERSDVVLEPWLAEQWFVNVKPLAEPAIQAVLDGKITFEPKRWENVYFNWMNDIRDWSISRQLWWGHQIPAWYDEKGQLYVGRTEAEVRDKHQLSQDTPLERDPDVLDTWFSSALWTFATLGWPTQTRELERFHPTNVLVTGHDIIFFWVARMIMMTLKFTGEVPFEKVYITGLVRDRTGQKMTKTKGNGIDPLDVIDGITLAELVAKRTKNLTQASLAESIEAATRKEYPQGIPAYGTDALRFTFCAIASPSSSYNFDLQQVEGYYYFCNKLWNATKFVLANVEGVSAVNHEVKHSLVDLWIRSRLAQLIEQLHRSIKDYRFDLYAQALYQFTWHEYCDWYVELTKPILFKRDANDPDVVAAKTTLTAVLDTLTRLLHPVMPYITEEIWQQLAPLSQQSGTSVMVAEFPAADEFERNANAEQAIEWLQRVVTAVRTIRSERVIPPKNEIQIMLSGGHQADRDLADKTFNLLSKLAKVRELKWYSDKDAVTGSTQLVDTLKITVPFESEHDREQESERLQKSIARLRTDLQSVDKKLANERFVERAPEDVVAKERERKSMLESQLTTLHTQLESIQVAV